MAMILITHDLGVVAEIADRVVVMYAGRKVEEAPVDDLFERRCIPIRRPARRDADRRGAARAERLAEIPGTVPPLGALPPGCAFAPRCPRVDRSLPAERPLLTEPRPRPAWSPASPPSGAA